MENEKNLNSQINNNENFNDAIQPACERSFIWGGTDSEKSSGVVPINALAMLKAGQGGIVLTFLESDCEQLKNYAKAAGREEDLVIFEPGGRNTVDLIALDFNQHGNQPGFAAQLTELLWDSINVGNANLNDGSFLNEATKLMLRHAIDVALFGKDKENPLTLQDIMDVIQQDPDNYSDVENMLDEIFNDTFQGDLKEWMKADTIRLIAEEKYDENDSTERELRTELPEGIYYAERQQMNADSAQSAEVTEDEFEQWLDYASEYGFDKSWLEQIFWVYYHVEFSDEEINDVDDENNNIDEGINDFDIQAALRYWFYEYPSLPEETQQSMRMILQARLGYMLLSPFRELLFSNNEETEAVNVLHAFGVDDNGDKQPSSKIVVLNIPEKTYRNPGIIAQKLFKQVWQRAAENH